MNTTDQFQHEELEVRNKIRQKHLWKATQRVFASDTQSGITYREWLVGQIAAGACTGFTQQEVTDDPDLALRINMMADAIIRAAVSLDPPEAR